MKQGQRTKKPANKKVQGCLIAFLCFMLIALSLPSYFLYKLYKTGRESRQTIAANMQSLQSPDTFPTVGLVLAMACQSKPDGIDISFAHKNAPHVLHDLMMPLMKDFKASYSYITIDPDLAIVEMYGGFYHYGYRMELNTKDSTDTLNRWELWVWHDEWPYCQLQVFDLPTDQCFTQEQLVQIQKQGTVDYSQFAQPVFVQTIAPHGKVGVDIDGDGNPLPEKQSNGEQAK